MVLEPLAVYNDDGELVPRLAESVPTMDNGGVSSDGMTVTWTLQSGLLWSDGTPLTAADAVFTYGYACALPDGNCENEPIESVEALDDLTLQITFKSPQSYPYIGFVGAGSVILQQAQFEDCLGEGARQCEMENFYPIGSGPYRITDFHTDTAGETSEIVYEINEHFRGPSQPFFSEVVLRGGGSEIDAARAVLETGAADYAWNMQIEPRVLQSLQAFGNGMVVAAFASNVERLVVNFTNPDTALGDQRSEWSEADPNPHPFLTDFAVRRALSLAIDRGQIADQLYGALGESTCNLITAPARYVSSYNDECLEQDIAEANALLDDAGWERGADDVRQKDDIRLRILYQTSTNAVRQETQRLIQEWWQEIGVVTDLKDIDAGEFFGGDPANDDTYGRFYADIQMYANGPLGIDPQTYLRSWRKSEIASRENDWGGANVPRWHSVESVCQYDDTMFEYDALYERLEDASPGQQREELIIALNDCVVQNYVVIPLVNRATVASALSSSIKGVRLNAWDAELWNIHEWYRE